MHWLGSNAKTTPPTRTLQLHNRRRGTAHPGHYAGDTDERKLLNDTTPRHYADSNEPFG